MPEPLVAERPAGVPAELWARPGFRAGWLAAVARNSAQGPLPWETQTRLARLAGCVPSGCEHLGVRRRAS
jgi:hypothetical protein